MRTNNFLHSWHGATWWCRVNYASTVGKLVRNTKHTMNDWIRFARRGTCLCMTPPTKFHWRNWGKTTAAAVAPHKTWNDLQQLERNGERASEFIALPNCNFASLSVDTSDALLACVCVCVWRTFNVSLLLVVVHNNYLCQQLTAIHPTDGI